MNITLNDEQRMYVMDHGGRYSCLGYDVCMRRLATYRDWMARNGMTDPTAGESVECGTMQAYRALDSVVSAIVRSGKKCTADLTPQLVGLEGKRVEVTESDGERRRFIVGMSTGPLPMHLEIATRRSHGGPAVTGAPFVNVRVVNSK